MDQEAGGSVQKDNHTMWMTWNVVYQTFVVNLNCPEFVDLINKKDHFFLVETKLTELDSVDLPCNNVYQTRNIKRIIKKASGAIAIIYIKIFHKYITFH